jgi:hypothetical protein
LTARAFWDLLDSLSRFLPDSILFFFDGDQMTDSFFNSTESGLGSLEMSNVG